MTGTVNERVQEAGNNRIREMLHDPTFHATNEDAEKAERMAADPRSDWPEPALTGDYIEEVKRNWLPPVGGVVKSAQDESAIHVPGSGGGDVVTGVDRVAGR